MSRSLNQRRQDAGIQRVSSQAWKSINAGLPSGRRSMLPVPRVSRCTTPRACTAFIRRSRSVKNRVSSCSAGTWPSVTPGMNSAAIAWRSMRNGRCGTPSMPSSRRSARSSRPSSTRPIVFRTQKRRREKSFTIQAAPAASTRKTWALAQRPSRSNRVCAVARSARVSGGREDGERGWVQGGGRQCPASGRLRIISPGLGTPATVGRRQPALRSAARGRNGWCRGGMTPNMARP